MATQELVAHDGVLEVGLAVLVLQVEELEEVGVADVVPQFGGVDGRGLACGGEHAVGVGGGRDALEELGADLPFQLPDGPTATDCLGLVEVPGPGVADSHQADVMGP